MVLAELVVSSAFGVLRSGGLTAHALSAHNATQCKSRRVGELVRCVGVRHKRRNRLVDSFSVWRLNFQERNVQLLRRARESGDRYGVIVDAWNTPRR